MNTTATTGIWEEQLSPDVLMIFDTTRNPQRISILHRNHPRVHLDYEDGITESDILKARARAKEAFNL